MDMTSEERDRAFQRVKEEAIRLNLLSFDSDTAFDIGVALKALAFATSPGRPVSISITHANLDQPMFFACSSPGVTPDHMRYSETMRNAVKCWGKSTQYLALKNPFWEQYPESWAEKYSYISGGWPIKVRGVEGVVAVVVVYGPSDQHNESYESNHNLIVQSLEGVLRKQKQNSMR